MGAVLAAVVVVFPPAKSYLMLKKKKQPIVVVLLILFFKFIDVPEHDFPLLHSLGINKTYQINTLLQELVKLKSSNDGVIKFRKRNNCPGCLLLAPTLRTTKKFATTVVQSNQ
jgi:hypothetical protein